MTDEIVNSGFGYTTDEVDTSKFTKEELNLWFNLAMMRRKPPHFNEGI